MEGYKNNLQKMSDESVKTALEAGFGIGLGVGLTLLEKNPAPAAALAVKGLNTVFVGAFGYDMSMRLGAPAVAVWNDPRTLKENQQKLGNNLGEFATNLALSVAGGFATEGIAEKVAQTRVGSFIQGYSELKVKVSDLDPAMQDIFKKKYEQSSSSEAAPVAANGQKVDALIGGQSADLGNAAAKKSMDDWMQSTVTLKQFKDGTRVGVTADTLTVANPDGLTYAFDRAKPKFLGLDSGMKLTQVKDPIKPNSPLDMLIKSGRLSEVADTYATSHTVANGLDSRTFESSAGRVNIKTDGTKNIREVSSKEDAISQLANGRWQYGFKAPDAAENAAEKTYDLSKLARSPFSLNSYISSTFYQTVVKEYVNPRVLDMGSDKVSHMLLLDHLGHESGTKELTKKPE
ncbi:MAG TPA: hypothetical protein V6C76_01655 [Drouetiella sp.]